MLVVSDPVGLPRRRTANSVVTGRATQSNSERAVGQRCDLIDRYPNIVPHNDIIVAATDPDAGPIATDEIACISSSAADQVVVPRQIDACCVVAGSACSIRCRANEIIGDLIIVPIDQYPVKVGVRYHVSLRR